MSATPPPHLDDETLSALIDGETDAAAAHLDGCAACRSRRDTLAEVRALIATPPAEAVDELTRRRLLTRALAEAPAAAPAPTRWYRQPAVLGIAAAVAALVLAVPVLNSLDSDNGDDSSAATAALPAEAPNALSADGAYLGDLGEISESLLRQRFGAESLESEGSGASRDLTEDAAKSKPAGQPEATVAAPTATPAPPSPKAATDPVAPAAGGTDDRTRRETEADDAAGAESYSAQTDSFANACVDSLLGGPARGGRRRATASGTFRGTPVIVAVFDTDNGAVAYVAERDGCRVLERYAL